LSRSARRQILVAAAAAILLAIFGGAITGLGPWYESLRKPCWQPPGPAFGIVWTTIHSLTTVAAVITWRRAPTGPEREWLVGLFALNGFLNILWSLLFFRLHRPTGRSLRSASSGCRLSDWSSSPRAIRGWRASC
jgi:benzodiazapine receptor